MKAKILPLMILMILFTPLIVLSYTKYELWDRAVLIYYPASLSQDNSSNLRLATVNGGVNLDTDSKKLGETSADFLDTTDNPVVFAADDTMTIIFGLS